MSKSNELHIFVHKNDVRVNKGGRPKLGKKKQRMITFSLPPQMVRSLKSLSNEKYVTVSALVRTAVVDYLNREHI